MNKIESDTANLNIILEHELIDHYKAVWPNDNGKQSIVHSNIETINYNNNSTRET